MLAIPYNEMLSPAHFSFHLFEFAEKCSSQLDSLRIAFDISENLLFKLHSTYGTHACIEAFTLHFKRMRVRMWLQNLHYYCSGLLVSSAKYALNDFEHATQLPSVY